jgi:hypothetical protein
VVLCISSDVTLLKSAAFVSEKVRVTGNDGNITFELHRIFISRAMTCPLPPHCLCTGDVILLMTWGYRLRNYMRIFQLTVASNC